MQGIPDGCGNFFTSEARQAYNQDYDGVERNYLYAGTCSTNNFMLNLAYLMVVHTFEDPLYIHTNAGLCIMGQQGFLGLQPFWWNWNEMANIVSL